VLLHWSRGRGPDGAVHGHREAKQERASCPTSSGSSRSASSPA
jgi:hypothetical protein